MYSSDYRPFIDITNSLQDKPPSLSPVLLNEDIESDITDMHVALQRTPSRLGFNVVLGGDCDGTRAENDKDAGNQARLEWTYGLSMDSQNNLYFKEEVPLRMDLPLSSSKSSELEDDLESSTESDYSDEGEPAGIISFRELTIPCSMNSSHPSANEPPIRPPPAPFLLAPLSPLSHCRGMTPSSARQPLEINHHGLSKSALMHQKWFWSARYDEWAAWEAQVEQVNNLCEAYGGMAILPGTCPGLNRHKDPSSRNNSPPSPGPSANPANPRIFPRLGDISALRDPYSVNIDRCFCHFPLWTVHKTLYMFDMHHRSVSLNDNPTMPVKTSDVLSTVDKAISDITGFNDNDVTLVSEDVSVGSISKEARSMEGYDANQPEDEDRDVRAWDGVRSWEISWYARWELLIELVKRDEVKKKVWDSYPIEPPPMFFFAGANDDEDDDEDEDDYGTIISNPLYGRRLQAGLGMVQDFFATSIRSGAQMVCA